MATVNEQPNINDVMDRVGPPGTDEIERESEKFWKERPMRELSRKYGNLESEISDLKHSSDWLWVILIVALLIALFH